MSMKSKQCKCASCAGAACKCGCQNAKTTGRDQRLDSRDKCNCSPTCSCKIG